MTSAFWATYYHHFRFELSFLNGVKRNFNNNITSTSTSEVKTLQPLRSIGSAGKAKPNMLHQAKCTLTDTMIDVETHMNHLKIQGMRVLTQPHVKSRHYAGDGVGDANQD